MQKIGILGGTFDPVHIAHLIVAQDVRDRLSLDTVLFVPCYLPPHKRERALASASLRLSMLELAVADNPAFGVSDIEIERGGMSYTVDTLKELQRRHPGDELYYIIGMDQFRDLPTWRQPEEVVRLARVVVVARGVVKQAAQQASSFADTVTFMNTRRIELSATEIRRRVAEGGSIKYLVPTPVEQFIFDHGLYTARIEEAKGRCNDQAD